MGLVKREGVDYSLTEKGTVLVEKIKQEHSEYKPAPEKKEKIETIQNPENSQLAESLSKYGKSWQKDGRHRIYLDPERVLEALGYKKTKKSYVTPDGEEMSNNKGNQLRSSLTGAFFDVTTGNFFADVPSALSYLQKLKSLN